MGKKTKVAFFAEILIHDFDGASRTMYQLLDRIPHDEFDFLFFCGVPPDKDLQSKVIKLPKIRIPFNWSYTMVVPLLSKKRIHKELREFNPDIIHIASPSALGSVASKFAKMNDIPVISIYHTHFITYMKYYFRKLPLLLPFAYKSSIKMTRDFYRGIDLVYAPSQQIIEELIDICKLSGRNLKLWQRGVDKALFNPQKRDPKYIRGIVNNELPNILFASRLVWEKNLKMLISLYQLCEKKGIKVNFIVAGDGVARKEAESKMPNAHFLGMIPHEELAIVYASSDIYFFPSDTESFGNVIIEAMASGLPCVAADGGGPKSLITDDVNGFLIPPDDEDKYLETIRSLLDNNDLKSRIITAGIEFTDALSWQELSATYFSDLVELTNRVNEKQKIPKEIG